MHVCMISFFLDTRKGQTTTITHIQNSIACLSRVHAMASSFLLSCTYHGSTSRPTFALFSVRSFPALALAAFGSCQPQRDQHHSQAPASHLASPIPSLCRCLLSAPSLISPHLTSPKPPLRRRRLHSAPSSAPLVITTTAHTLSHPRPPPTTICSITTPEAVAGHVLHPSP